MTQKNRNKFIFIQTLMFRINNYIIGPIHQCMMKMVCEKVYMLFSKGISKKSDLNSSNGNNMSFTTEYNMTLLLARLH